MENVKTESINKNVTDPGEDTKGLEHQVNKAEKNYIININIHQYGKPDPAPPPYNP